MKRIPPIFTLLVLLLTMACMAEDTHAQLRKEDVTLRFGAGAGLPVTPSAFSDGYRLGLSMSAGLGLAISPSLKLVIEGSYSRFSTDPRSFGADPLAPDVAIPGEVEGGDLGVLSGGVDLQYAFISRSQVTPYLLGGLGVYEVHRDPLTARRDGLPPLRMGDAEQTAFGINFGVGVRIPVSWTAALFIEPCYTIIYTGPENLHIGLVRAGFVFGRF